jgi:hypothetical protein
VNSRIFHQDSKNERQDFVEKEETTNNRLRAMDVGALPHQSVKENDEGKPGLACTL